MKPLFPWEFFDNLDNYFLGPYLFKALFRIYKGANFGEGFQLIGNYPKNKNLLNQIDTLPLDLKRIIFYKLWEVGNSFKEIVVHRKKLLLNTTLYYLFPEYKKFQLITRIQIPRHYAAWNGIKIERQTYVFTYGPINFLSNSIIPDFLYSKDNTIPAISFKLICP